MSTGEVFETGTGQSIRLPDDIRFNTPMVSVRKVGESVILEPLKPTEWPAGFFESIRIDDPQFKRPDQGVMPPAPQID